MAHPSTQRVFLLALSLTLTASTLPFVSSAALADDDGGAAAPGIARISAIEGDVAIKHSADGDGVAAIANAPVEAGDYLSAGSDGRAEVELDGRDVLRADSGAQLRFTQLDGSSDVAQLAAGTVELRAFDGYQDHVTVQTPSVDISPDEAGAYVITVEQNGNTDVTARSGSVTVGTPQGSQQLQPGRTMEIAGNANDPQYQYVAAIASDSFEGWNDDRDREVLQVASLAPYENVNNDMVGADDLARDGRWINTPDYGEVWQPSDVAANWTPYSSGSWAYEPYYGYTWVATEPWGWAPYHYGRWFFQPGLGWAWAPGPRVVRPVWSPALVTFFGFGGGGLSLGFGNIGWVPLAPGEVVHRWWGPGNTIVYNNTIIINHYRNYNRGIVAMPVNNWQRGDFGHIVHLQSSEVRDVRAIAGRIPLAPTRENYRFAPHETRVTIAQTNYQRFKSRTITRAPMQPARSTTWQRFGSAPARANAPLVARHSDTPTQSTWQRFNNTNITRPQRSFEPSTYARQQPAYARQQPLNRRSEPVARQAPREHQPAAHQTSRPRKHGVMR